jgi:hypothetical protein
VQYAIGGIVVPDPPFPVSVLVNETYAWYGTGTIYYGSAYIQFSWQGYLTRAWGWHGTVIGSGTDNTGALVEVNGYLDSSGGTGVLGSLAFAGIGLS